MEFSFLLLNLESYILIEVTLDVFFEDFSNFLILIKDLLPTTLPQHVSVNVRTAFVKVLALQSKSAVIGTDDDSTVHLKHHPFFSID